MESAGPLSIGTPGCIMMEPEGWGIMRRLAVIACITVSVCAAQTERTNPLANDPRAVEDGRIAFRNSCTTCHGIHGEGGRGPDLTLGGYSVGDSDAALFNLLSNGVAGTEMPGFAGRYESDEIWRLVSYVKTLARQGSAPVTGNPDAGRQLFWDKGGCGQCHMVEGKGGRMGPDLTSVGRRRSLAYLKESIVNPNADVTPGFYTITVVTKDGKKIIGVQRGFDDFSAQLMDSKENLYSFERSNVASIKREVRSLMPDSYKTMFEEKELNDLLAYLTSLRGVQEAGR